MWTEITRPKCVRAGQRYASDLTDAEWALIAPYLPEPKALGRPRETDLRAMRGIARGQPLALSLFVVVNGGDGGNSRRADLRT